MNKNDRLEPFLRRNELTPLPEGRYSYRDIRETRNLPNATNTTFNLLELNIMLNASINTSDPKIKRNDFSSSHNVLEGLSSIRKRNEELVEALDHSVARFEEVLAFYQTDAYAS